MLGLGMLISILLVGDLRAGHRALFSSEMPPANPRRPGACKGRPADDFAFRARTRSGATFSAARQWATVWRCKIGTIIICWLRDHRRHYRRHYEDLYAGGWLAICYLRVTDIFPELCRRWCWPSPFPPRWPGHIMNAMIGISLRLVARFRPADAQSGAVLARGAHLWKRLMASAAGHLRIIFRTFCPTPSRPSSSR